jgi:hypothetical protein
MAAVGWRHTGTHAKRCAARARARAVSAPSCRWTPCRRTRAQTPQSGPCRWWGSSWRCTSSAGPRGRSSCAVACGWPPRVPRDTRVCQGSASAGPASTASCPAPTQAHTRTQPHTRTHTHTHTRTHTHTHAHTQQHTHTHAHTHTHTPHRRLATTARSRHSSTPRDARPPDGRRIRVVQRALVQRVHAVLLGKRRGRQVVDDHLQQRLGRGQPRLWRRRRAAARRVWGASAGVAESAWVADRCRRQPTDTHTHTRAHAHTRTHTHTQQHTRTHTHTHTATHTHTQQHTRTPA